MPKPRLRPLRDWDNVDDADDDDGGGAGGDPTAAHDSVPVLVLGLRRRR